MTWGRSRIPEWDYYSIAIARDEVKAEDMLDSFRYHYYFIDEKDGKNVRLARNRLVLGLALL